MKKIETIEAISSDEDEVIIEKPKRAATASKPPTPQPTPQPAPKPKIVPYKFV